MTLTNHLTAVPNDLLPEDSDENAPQIVVRIPLGLANQCAQAARKEGIPEADFIRRAIRRGIEARKGDAMLQTLLIEERGDGLPAIGDHVEHHATGDIFVIRAYGRPAGAMAIDPNSPGASHRIRVRAEIVDVDPETVDIHDSLIREIVSDRS